MGKVKTAKKAKKEGGRGGGSGGSGEERGLMSSAGFFLCLLRGFYFSHISLFVFVVITLTSNRFREHKQSKCLIQVHHLLWNLRDNAAPTYFKMVDLAVFV